MAVLDRFSKQANEYAAARPTYPDELFGFLAEKSPAYRLAWDCGTGNGQVAIKLPEYFDKIYATDISAAQLANARPHKKIQYQMCGEGSSGLQDGGVDLITVAQAVHWFDLEMFYKEANRVLGTKGVIALWGYGFMSVSDGEIDVIFQKLGRKILKDYWDENVKKIWEGYERLPFPFERIDHPRFMMKIDWSFDGFTGYVSSWSAAQKFKDKNNSSPLDLVWDDLTRVWGDPDRRHTFFVPLTMLSGRKT